jgi:ribonuclease J
MHPDFSWLLDEADGLDAVVITHGHEDHIGALPYLLKSRRVPVYAPPYAARLIEDRLSEHRLKNIDLRVTDVGSRIDIGALSVERFGVHHSIADATGLILDTPVGTIIHTGDFKIESDPCDGQRFDRDRLKEVAEAGVRLLLSDSTGADVEGRSGLERHAEAALERHVWEAPARVVVATFSSNVFRLRAALRIAREVGRKVCLLGMSVNKHVEVARELGWIPPVESLLIAPEDVETSAPTEVMIIAGGTQGEAASSLTRLARDEHTRVYLDEGDTVIFSSRIIPGNELAVFDVINRFEERGIRVITRREFPDVHASGHGGREEQRTMIQLLRPEAFVPVHGTHHHQRRHLEIAHEEGIDQTALVSNGSVLEVTRDSLRLAGRVPSGRVYIDGMRPLSAGLMEERRAMGAAGCVTMRFVLRSGRLRERPLVVSQGVFEAPDRRRSEHRIAEHVYGQLRRARFRHLDDAEDAAIEAAKRYLRHNHRSRPLVIAEADGER